MRRCRESFVLLLSGVLLSFPVMAGAVYRWVDEQGRVHFSDAIPTSSKTKVTPLDLSTADVSEQQRQQAKARLVKEQARLQTPGDVAEPIPIPIPAAPPQTPKQAISLSPDASCDEQWAAFDQSWACFNPYRMANGSVNAEAFEHCSEMPAPACIRAAK